jgi:hypothetical protein
MTTKSKIIALNLNFTNVKFSHFRKTEYDKKWFVEFYGGTGENFEGYVIKIPLEDLEYFFNDMALTFESELIRFNYLARSYRKMVREQPPDTR